MMTLTMQSFKLTTPITTIMNIDGLIYSSLSLSVNYSTESFILQDSQVRHTAEQYILEVALYKFANTLAMID